MPQDITHTGEPLTHEEVARACYTNNWVESLDPVKLGPPVDYELYRASVGSRVAADMAISTHSHLSAIVQALRGHAKQFDDLKLTALIAVEKLALMEGRLGATGYHEESKRVVARVMAGHQLTSGRVVSGIPIRSNRDVVAVFSVATHVQKIACVVLAHIPWHKNMFIKQVRTNEVSSK